MHIFSTNAGRYGLAMTAFTAAWVLLMHVTGQYGPEYEANPLDLLFIVIVPFIVWYLGIKAKKTQKKGKLTFKEGVKEGFQISLVYGITSPFLFGLYYLLINPAVVQSLKPEYGMAGVSDTQIILIDMLAQFISAIVFGTLYAAIISYFLKSKSVKK